MATRTQKAAMKKKADDAAKAAKAQAKADKAHAKAHGEAQQAVAKPKPAKPPKSTSSKAKPGKAKAPAKSAKASKSKSTTWEPVQEEGHLPEPKRVSFAERFWHRLGARAAKSEAKAHQHEAELEAAEAAEEKARVQREADERKRQAAEERRKAAESARELKRAAQEEERRLAEEAEERKRAAKAERAEQARAAREAKAEAARAAKDEAERKAAERREARKAQRAAKGADEEAEEGEAIEVEVLPEDADAGPLEPAEPEAEPVVEDEPEPEPEPVRARAKPTVTVREAGDDEEPEEAPAARPSKPERAAPPPAETELDRHADKLAAELAARRSKPITIDVEEDAVPTLPVGRAGKKEEPKEVLQLDPAPPARIPDAAALAAPRGLSIPEHYLLLSLGEGWDERTEKAKAGALGGGLTGALLLQLLAKGVLKVQRDRFILQNGDLDDADERVAKKLQQYADRPSLQAMAELAKWLPQLLPAYKDRMAERGLVAHKAWRHLGLAYRSQTVLLDQSAQDNLRNKLARAIAGGGRPDAPTILSLGLLEASGLFGLVVPEGAQAYNRKRLNGLLGGKDVMGYKVDDELKGIQEIAVRTILDNVRTMTTKG